MENNYYALDFLIITALNEELKAVVSKLESFKVEKFDTKMKRRAFTCFIKDDYKIIAFSINGMGRVQAALATSEAINIWKPRVILLAGIAGGVKGKVELGDVIIPKEIYDYELRKLRVVKNGSSVVRKDSFRGRSQPVSTTLFNYGTPELLKGFDCYIQEKNPDNNNKIPLHHGKLIASGDKSVAISEFMDQLEDERDQVIGIEMEGAGVANAVWESELKPEFLMIKSISDYADEEESSSETKKWRKYACDSAAAATKKYIEVIIENKVYKPFQPDPILPLKSVINAREVDKILSNGDLCIFICEFETYRNLAINISKSSTELVLWVLAGSPLNSKKLQKNELTRHDEEFSKFTCADKQRVVIFEEPKDIENYVNASGNDEKRRNAFEKSCSSPKELHFGCHKLLMKKFTLPGGFDFDFGFVSKSGVKKNAHEGYCFHSPFSSGASQFQKSHVTFLDTGNVSPGFRDDILEDKTKYQLILQGLPHYPKLIEHFRKYKGLETKTLSENDVLLYGDASELLERCNSCDICN